MTGILAEPPCKTWTRVEMEVLEAAGHLAETRYELIDGEVFDTSGISPLYAATVCGLVARLATVFAPRQIRTRMPVEPAERDAPHSQPEPAVAVTREPNTAFRARHPGAADVLLIAEISDSTLDYNTKRKARLYARAGFVEYIVLDLDEQELLVFHAPRGGVYTEVRALRPADVFCPVSALEANITVAELLGE